MKYGHMFFFFCAPNVISESVSGILWKGYSLFFLVQKWVSRYSVIGFVVSHVTLSHLGKVWTWQQNPEHQQSYIRCPKRVRAANCFFFAVTSHLEKIWKKKFISAKNSEENFSHSSKLPYVLSFSVVQIYWDRNLLITHLLILNDILIWKTS